jgi:hypothetical protein
MFFFSMFKRKEIVRSSEMLCLQVLADDDKQLNSSRQKAPRLVDRGALSLHAGVLAFCAGTLVGVNLPFAACVGVAVIALVRNESAVASLVDLYVSTLHHDPACSRLE